VDLSDLLVSPPLEELIARPRWMKHGACREHPSVDFFPAIGESTRPAKLICAGCSVRDACVSYAVANREQGVWGGTSDRERSRIRAGITDAA
jgi:WhiB family redox-sensing transcriptional regulator